MSFEIKRLDSTTIRYISTATFREALNYFIQTPVCTFALEFQTLLKENEFEAYFFECPPVTRILLDRPFEFVLINAPELAKVSPDFRAFASHFTTGDIIIYCCI
jgi:hypothetical protein